MGESFAVASAQISIHPFPSVAENVANHLRCIRLAAEHDAQLLVFPELSSTGYSLQLPAGALFTVGDERLHELHDACRETGVTACVGVPLRSNVEGKAHIASVVLHPDGCRHAHTKRFLDPSEVTSFAPGSGGPLLDFSSPPGSHDESIALAICADTSNPVHPLSASRAGATLYAAGSVISSASYDAECTRLST